jgi:hypothetical protein
MNDYDDIINLERPLSKHSHLSMESRAAQFAPFAALTGYDKQVKEVARLTEKRILLDEERKEIINNKLKYINEHINSINEVTIKYFIKDEFKSGGRYIIKNCNVKKIDSFLKKIKLTDNTIISIKDIVDINFN